MLCQTQPANQRAKVYDVAGWALLGLFICVLCYPILFDLIAFGLGPGWHEGAGFGLVLLFISPWGWYFLALCAFSLALIPAIAMHRGVGLNYGRFVFFLVRVWAVGFVLTGTILILAYHSLALESHKFNGWLAESFIGLFMLSIPAVLALVLVILGYACAPAIPKVSADP